MGSEARAPGLAGSGASRRAGDHGGRSPCARPPVEVAGRHRSARTPAGAHGGLGDRQDLLSPVRQLVPVPRLPRPSPRAHGGQLPPGARTVPRSGPHGRPALGRDLAAAAAPLRAHARGSSASSPTGETACPEGWGRAGVVRRLHRRRRRPQPPGRPRRVPRDSGRGEPGKRHGSRRWCRPPGSGTCPPCCARATTRAPAWSPWLVRPGWAGRPCAPRCARRGSGSVPRVRTPRPAAGRALSARTVRSLGWSARTICRAGCASSARPGRPWPSSRKPSATAPTG